MNHSEQRKTMSEERERKTRSVGVRVTPPLKELMNKYLEMDAHVSYGDLIRDALREKIRRDAPELYDELFEKKEEGR